MAEGPGKYDDLATYVREKAQADGVIVVVLGGNKGPGFSAQIASHTPVESMLTTVQVIRRVADQIEADAKRRQA
jgi:methylmalonyl-CoA mutase cobalamin-binding subunit